jgi:hypothetical protein
MASSNQTRVAGVGAVLFALFVLPAGSAHAGKEVFVRSKPHVNVSTNSTFVGGSQAVRQDAPWRRRPKLK